MREDQEGDCRTGDESLIEGDHGIPEWAWELKRWVDKYLNKFIHEDKKPR